MRQQQRCMGKTEMLLLLFYERFGDDGTEILDLVIEAEGAFLGTLDDTLVKWSRMAD